MRKKRMKMTKDKKKVLAAIKRIRDSFHESCAVYTCGRCYHFAKILQEIFGGDLYEDDGHVLCKIGSSFYDIRGEYTQRKWIALEKIDEDGEASWDGNYQSGTVEMFMERYNDQ